MRHGPSDNATLQKRSNDARSNLRVSIEEYAIVAIPDEFYCSHHAFAAHLADVGVTDERIGQRLFEIRPNLACVIHKAHFIQQLEIGDAGRRAKRMR